MLNGFNGIKIMLVTCCKSVAVFALSLVLSSCALDEPSAVNQKRVELHKQEYAYKEPLKDFDKEDVTEMANHHYRYSNGPSLLTVTYDPKSAGGSAMQASLEVARISKMLRKAGVTDVATDILPVSGDSMVLFTYEEITAHKPEGCEVMPGVEGTITEVDGFVDHNGSYKIGCSIETTFAKQIQRPRDLLGNSNSAYIDGRRAANVATGYGTGEANEPLQGEQASDD